MAGLTMRAAVGGLKSARKGKQGGTWHLHQCSNRTCRRPFPHACQDPLEEHTQPADLQCFLCRGVAHGWPRMYLHLLPGRCCATESRQVTAPEDARTYKLAGPGPWFQCQTCFRVSGWPQPTPEETAT